MVIERWRMPRRITPWHSFKELEDTMRHFDDMFAHPLLPIWRRVPSKEEEWAPAIEVFEKNDKYVVKADIPGVKEEDVDVSVVGDTLTIRGKREAEHEVKEEDYYCCERSYGSFFRSIALPSNVDAKKIDASFEDGVLEVSLPKTAEVKPKKIAVSAKKKTVK